MVHPKEVFKTAEIFRATPQILTNLIPREPQYILPLIICSSFSLELHLKCLILIEGGTPGKLHDLERLFSKLTPNSQKIIRACYEPARLKRDAMFAGVYAAAKIAPRTDFDSVLHAGAKAFENLRYHFEGVAKDQGWMAGPIRDCVRQRIIELHPEWET